MSEFIIQAIGFTGMAFFIASYQIKSNRALFACQLTGCIIFCIQFFIMGAYTGVLSESITLMSIIISVARFGWKEMGKEDSDFQD